MTVRGALRPKRSTPAAVYLAPAVPLAIGAVNLARQTTVPALAAYAVFAALHLAFHASHSPGTTAGSVTLDVGLGALLVVATALLAASLHSDQPPTSRCDGPV